MAAETVWQLVENRAKQSPEAVMLIDEHGRTLTFGQFRDRALGLASALAAAGIGPGSRVAWQLSTRMSTLLVLVALRRLGAVQAPLIPIYREREVVAALRTSEADTILVPEGWAGNDYALPEGLKVVVLDEDASGTAALPEVPDDPDAVQWIFFTSGSTGAPKGARHTDRSLTIGCPEFVRRSELTTDDVGIIAFPVAHIGGVLSLITMLHAGFPAVLVETFSPAAVIGLMRRHQVTFMGGSPVFYAMLLGASRAQPGAALVPSLRLFKGGGAPCSEHLYRAVRDELGVTIAHDYNMTESPMITVSSTTDSDDQLAHTEGRPIDGCEVRISAEGEVQVRGPIVCKGYTDEAETTKAFTEDGWFRTGDLGRLRPDGHLEITGRIKDLIIRKGENIAPLEIEELLSARPDIAEAAVIGLPDATAGEIVCAVITRRPDVSAPELTELTTWLREAGLMTQKLPEVLHVVDVMPRTATGKFDKPTLRAAYS